MPRIRNNNRRRKSPNWALSSLEPRMMLAADAGAVVADSAAGETPAMIGEAASLQNAQNSSTLVFVDPSVDNFSQLTQGMDSSAEIIILNSQQDGIDQISQALASRSNVQSVHVIAHGTEGSVQLGSETVNERALVDAQSQIRGWRSSMTADADILLYSCDTGKGQTGQNFIARLASLSGADVAASTDLTGGSTTAGDWDLEVQVGEINTAIVLNHTARERYTGTLELSIRAAGVTGDEEMRLLVNGQVVQSWTVGGDANAGQFETYSVNLNGVNADDVRIEFTNDLYDPSQGIDRNLRVDSITIDGTVYQTEDPSVFSTGSWIPGEGITPGFDQSEYLNTNGYFQFAGTNNGGGGNGGGNSGGGQNNGTQIRIAASGDQGGENLSLVIGGQTVESWTVGTSESVYTYNASSNVSIEDVQIHFTNDQYDPNNGIDSNLNVNYVELNGSRYETEASTTFSTGSWRPEDGLQPGFRLSETLNSNGYFQYGAGGTFTPPTNPSGDPTSPDSGPLNPTPVNPNPVVPTPPPVATGSLLEISAYGSEGGETMTVFLNDSPVKSWNVTTQQSTYTVQFSEDVKLEDLKIQFTGDAYDPDNGFDANLIVDYIKLDGTQFETEAPTTFSTGSWLPTDGVQAGFRQSETLNVDGFFQFTDDRLIAGGGIGGGSGPSAPPVITDPNLVTTTGRDIVIGSNAENTIVASFSNDVVFGLGGNDAHRGDNGNDVLNGLKGDDAVNGGNGDDVLFGGDGDDAVNGGPGNDRLFGGKGSDNLDGDLGDDDLYPGLGDDFIRGGVGIDTVVLQGNRLDYTVRDLGGQVELRGPDGIKVLAEMEFVRFADVTIPLSELANPEFGFEERHFVEFTQNLSGDQNILGTYELNDKGEPDNFRLIVENSTTQKQGELVGEFASNDIKFFVIHDAAHRVNLDPNNFPTLTFENGALHVDGEKVRRAVHYTDSQFNDRGREHFRYSDEGNGEIKVLYEDYEDKWNDFTLTVQTIKAPPQDGFVVLPGSDGATNGDDTLIGQDVIAGEAVQGDNLSNTLKGTDRADTIFGLDGDDVLNGRGGNDTLDGGKGADKLNGDAGDDLIFGQRGNDILRGGAGNDILLPGADNDTVYGGDGVDTIVLNGFESNYQFNDLGNGTYEIIGPDGFNKVSEVENVAFFDVVKPIEAVVNPNFGVRHFVDLVENTDGEVNDLVFTYELNAKGLPDNFRLLIRDTSNVSNGRLGEFSDPNVRFMIIDNSADRISFDPNNPPNLEYRDGRLFVDGDAITRRDVLYSDKQFSTTGREHFRYTDNGDGTTTVKVESDPYNDEFDDMVFTIVSEGPEFSAPDIDVRDFGLNSGDVLVGLAGDDTLIGLGGDDNLLGGAGNDFLDGGDGKDFLDGGEGFNTIVAGAGDDVINLGRGFDNVDGGSGFDTIVLIESSEPVNVDLTRGSVVDAFGRQTQTLQSIEGVVGSAKDDTFTFDNLQNGDYFSVNGTEGYDELRLRQYSISQVQTGNGKLTINLVNGGTATIGFKDIEKIRLQDAVIDATNGNVTILKDNDLIVGDTAPNRLNGGAGDDVIYGGNGNDNIEGGTGDDILFGGQGGDDIFGGDGDDEIFGENGDDTLNGGSGDDTITDGLGDDIVDGGQGFDIAIIEGNREDFTVDRLSDNRVRVVGKFGVDIYSNIEGFRFNDGVFTNAELEG